MLFNDQDLKNPSTIDNFFVAASAFALIHGGMQIDESGPAITRLLKEIRGQKLQVTPEIQRRLEHVLHGYKDSLHAFSAFEADSQTRSSSRDLIDQMTEDGVTFDSTISPQGLSPEFPEYDGEEPDSIEVVSPTTDWLLLDEKSKQLLEPILKANHQSRQAMIDAAKMFAAQHFGVNEERLNRTNPPGWFTNSKTGSQAIHSREIVMYVQPNTRPIELGSGAFDLNAVLQETAEQPNILTFLDTVSRGYGRGENVEQIEGWVTIRLSDSEKPSIVFIQKLAR